MCVLPLFGAHDEIQVPCADYHCHFIYQLTGTLTHKAEGVKVNKALSRSACQ
jgi:hypothetical protein